MTQQQLDTINLYNDNTLTSNCNNVLSNTTSLVQYSLSVLLNHLKSVGYFHPHKKRDHSFSDPDERVTRILNCDPITVTHRVLYDCGCSIDVPMGCMSRLCPHCYLKILRASQKKAAFIVRNMSWPRFLTYGTKNYNKLTPDVYRQESVFKRKIFYCLRNQKYPKTILQKYSSKELIKKYRGHNLTKQKYFINSYVDVTEHKYNPLNLFCNLHHHIVWDGSYIPQELFSDLMRYFSKGESYYCYIQDIKARNPTYNRYLSAKIVSSYVTKYLGKTNLPNDIDKQVEFYTATRHAHLINFYPSKTNTAFNEYKLKCPICHTGLLCGLYPLDENKNIIIYTKPFDSYFLGKKPPSQNFNSFHSYDDMMRNIKHLLNLEGNADKVEEILSMKQIEDLLRKGYLYQPRFDTYKELL